MTDEGELIAGRYRLTSRLGIGAMGEVWKGQDERLHRVVAIKQLLLPWGLSDGEVDEANRRALREGRITARLHHPHAIAVYDVAEHDGQPCLIMEYLPSRSLATVLSIQGVLRPEEVANIGSQIASALAAAHEAGIVHRDIKPGNVLLADDGIAKITDFGISHAVGDVTVTATGILAGTPAYLAPELAQGNSADFPSDVFSLGATLYTALEGAPPFGLSDNAMAQLHRVASGEITPPTQSGPLAPILQRLLQRNPDKRPTMQQAQNALATLATALGGPEGDPPLPMLPLSGNGAPAKPASRTQRIRTQPQPPAAAPVPARPTPVTRTANQPPAVGDGDGSPRRRGLVAGIMALVLLATGALVIVLLNTSGNGSLNGDNAASPNSNSGGVAPSRSAPPTQPAGSSPTQEGPPSGSQGNGGSQANAEQPQRAITDYYSLVPGNLPAAWSRLTTRYQQSHAGGFTGYQDFWRPVQRVTVSDVSASQDGTVQATIHYSFQDGRVVEELTSFGLVPEDGLLKIDSSTVSSSQTK